ncbi:GCN5-related N-acetyltransferase [Nostocoides japonicum T1-X7]|uniref:GCN5-related N-acetyltransferase n=1 Tax=Nostocoides japonicum T1-X7 TaxID=1194083 RepID=A0A077LZW4_9MICO|nr:GNAT family N-acetyltransferase [Tetrasphaera japonica]CCH79543.1 GCN5-related N-acetyltransferase [Tetrasphaera japonica T1-X7]
MTIADLKPEHVEQLVALFQRLPDSDLTFIKEDVSPAAVTRWIDAPGWRWVDLAEDGSVIGYAALRAQTGWSDHVGDLRLVVDPAARGRGVGRALTLHALGHALRSGLLKVVVELPAEQTRTIDMFLGLGFTGEALLRDHFRDRTGQLRDLVMLAHFAEQTYEAMDLVGVADALEEGL